jgi:putative nucleotidyltransferase with HDIG domain
MNKTKAAKRDLFKTKLYSIVILLLAIMVALLGILQKVSDAGHLIDRHNIATTDIVASHDYYDKEATIAKANKAKDSVEPIAVRINSSQVALYENIFTFFDVTNRYREKTEQLFLTSQQYNAEIDGLVKQYTGMLPSSINISHNLAKAILQDVNSTSYDSYKTVIRAQFSVFMDKYIFYENLAQHQEEFEVAVNQSVTDNNLKELTNVLKSYLIQINSRIDTGATEKERQRVYDDVITNSPVLIMEGTVLYQKGEKLENEDILALYERGVIAASDEMYMYIGAVALFLLCLLASFASVKIYGQTVRLNPKSIFIMVILFFMVYIPALYIPHEYYMYIPYFLLPMMLSILVSDNISFIFSGPMAIFYCYIVGGDLIYLAILLIGSIATIYFVRKTSARIRLAISGIALGVINVALYMSYKLITSDVTISIPYPEIIALFVASVVSSLLCLGLLPVFEVFFNIVTPFKLMELASPTKPLLKRLMMEAPGTYHHSLMVGNLAEEAAEAIGANGLLARVGAYYHDIGKLNRPAFFGENQSSKTGNPHNTITPQLSATIITGHTTEGADLAKQAKLPPSIRDIIVEHHGTTLVEYFYHKAKNASDEPVIEEDFRYSGPKPRTKESACVMLADACEATIRSMENTNIIEIEKTIRRVAKTKRDDGQFDQCDLTLKELDEILFAFMKVFTGYFHKRIKYPNQQSDDAVKSMGLDRKEDDRDEDED